MKKRQPMIILLLVLALVLCFPCVGEAGWKTKKGKRMYYVTSTKSYVKSSWKKIAKKWYYFDAKGHLKTGRFKVGGKYYYCKKSTGRVSKKWVGSYYYEKNGVMAAKKWLKLNGKEYYFGANGKRKFGKFTVDGKTYYCTKEDGKLTSSWKDKNYYGEDGVMATNCWVEKRFVNESGVITEGNKKPKDTPTPSEIRLLAAITYLEAGNQSYYGKQCVASVVMNRVNSKKFPNTIHDVLYQSGQFTPAGDGRLASLYNSKKKVQAECVKAAKYVLTNGSVLKGYYYFNNFSGRLQVGDHFFS